MISKPAEMVDLTFDLSGGMPPANYPFTLWTALTQVAPVLAETDRVGTLPLRLPEQPTDALPRRTKLALRIPTSLSEALTLALSGEQLQLEDVTLKLGMGRPRAITPFPTVHAQQVASDEPEVQFMEGIRARLDEMRIPCNLICGMHRFVGDEHQSIQGYSLVIHDLKLEASLRLQYAGLGDARHFGCGVFVPYKIISGLDDD